MLGGGQARATSISRSGSVRSEQRRLRPKDMPPCGLRPIWPVASLLSRSSIAADTLPPSRLATGQIGRNERMRIYEIDHLDTEAAFETKRCCVWKPFDATDVGTCSCITQFGPPQTDLRPKRSAPRVLFF